MIRLSRNLFHLRQAVFGCAIVACALYTMGPAHAAQALITTEQRMAADDLEVAFAQPGKPSIFIARAELHQLGVLQQKVYIPYVDATLDCLVIPLLTVAEAVGLTAAHTVLAESYDGYWSVYQPAFIETYAPFILLEIEGNAAGDLTLEGAPDLGPYYVTFAKQLKQGSPELPDPDNKRPYGVSKLTVGTYEALFADLYAGPLAELDSVQASGRELFINNCMSCHAWKPDGLGGRFSNRIVPILSVHAKYNAEYFKNYVYEPSKFLPEVKMPAHPHYDDAQIDSLIRFLLEVPQS